jgi:hypothetical protein
MQENPNTLASIVGFIRDQADRLELSDLGKLVIGSRPSGSVYRKWYRVSSGAIDVLNRPSISTLMPSIAAR